MSNWYRKTENGETGPHTFQDLAGLIAQGELTEHDLVRREDEASWTAVESVVGLIRAARLKVSTDSANGDLECQPTETSMSTTIAESTEVSEDRPARNRSTTKRLARRDVQWVIGLGLMIISGIVAAWWSLSDPTFPFPRDINLDASQKGALHEALPPRPKTPTIPGLPERVPAPLPGFEDVTEVFSVSLTPDLLTIVYSGFNRSGGTEDLFISRRDSLTQPFPAPELISHNSTSAIETQPAISADGLMLLYVRHSEAKNPTLHLSRRPTVTSPFPESEPLSFGQHDGSVGYLFSPQMLDGGLVKLNLVGKEDQDRQVIEFPMPPPSTTVISDISFLEFNNPWQLYFIARDRLRAYSGTPDGLFLSHRATVHRPFGPPTNLVSAAECGEVLGSVWVSPAQDVIVFCSSGTGASGLENCRVWIMRF